ncbi:GntR family transcriptional regulator [Streptococcus pneumoniae]|nr:GntR family transcriptional regulator [Streptococcus pneumoniae]
MSTKYLFIYNEIREKILCNKYTMNEQLPDEMTLAKQFACSRMTIKKALDLLVSEGLIFRKRGQGTFVLSRGSSKRKLIVPERDIRGLTKISEDAHSTIDSRIIHFKLEFANEFLAEKLQVALQSPVYNIYRLRIIDGKPYVLEQTYMSTDVIPGITEDILQKSIYNVMEGKLGLHIASATKILRASSSSENEQHYLQLLPTEPVFEVEQVAYLDNGTPFEYSISRHRYDLFEFNSFALRHSS